MLQSIKHTRQSPPIKLYTQFAMFQPHWRDILRIIIGQRLRLGIAVVSLVVSVADAAHSGNGEIIATHSRTNCKLSIDVVTKDYNAKSTVHLMQEHVQTETECRQKCDRELGSQAALNLRSITSQFEPHCQFVFTASPPATVEHKRATFKKDCVATLTVLMTGQSAGTPFDAKLDRLCGCMVASAEPALQQSVTAHLEAIEESKLVWTMMNRNLRACETSVMSK